MNLTDEQLRILRAMSDDGYLRRGAHPIEVGACLWDGLIEPSKLHGFDDEFPFAFELTTKGRDALAQHANEQTTTEREGQI